MKINPSRYLEQVYAGVLGKVIGVYLGRPIEGWKKADIEARFGRVDRYLAAEKGVPLVVSDDDISGTFTFLRAIEDSGKGLETKAADFAAAWRNYLIEGKTVLWWGGRGVSTEHTAWLNLMAGIDAPASGSRARNGRVVSEQIGAQIFIDGIGLALPGRPDLAARMAKEAASVSHDGEAVYAAQVVATMVSAAFEESRIDRLLDEGVARIPADSLVAEVHRDVRAWVMEDGDWNRTFERISEKWGYGKFGGGCHVLPNHALMVLAWASAGDDFAKAQLIVNTCGWDTDCNAANVGSVLGVALGLKALTAGPDFRAPFADRILLPTAEGTDGVDDCLRLAERIASTGLELLGEKPLHRAKGGAWHHFSIPGSLHGWMAAASEEGRAGRLLLRNPSGALEVTTPVFEEGEREVMSIPLIHLSNDATGYSSMGSPRVKPGQVVRLVASVAEGDGEVEASWFGETVTSTDPVSTARIEGDFLSIARSGAFVLEWRIPSFEGAHLASIGIVFRGRKGAWVRLVVDRIEVSKMGSVRFTSGVSASPAAVSIPGWIHAVDRVCKGISRDAEDVTHIVKNRGRGVLCTGGLQDDDGLVSARIGFHSPGAGGLVGRYRGLERFVSLEAMEGRVRLCERFDGELRILCEAERSFEPDALSLFQLRFEGSKVRALIDGVAIGEGVTRLASGGFGFVVEEANLIFRDFSAEPI